MYQEGYECLDLGIVKDIRSTLKDMMLDAVTKCDVVVTSGGVSMGDADFVKGILQEIGKVMSTLCLTNNINMTLLFS